MRVNSQTVNDTSDFSHAIRSTSSGSVTVGVIRDKREQTLTLPLPERKDSGGMLEESFDTPDFDAEVPIDLTEMRDQIAQLKPQMQFALQESIRMAEEVRPEIEKAQREAREELERAKPKSREGDPGRRETAAEYMRSELCSQEREFRQQTQKLQKEVQKQRRDILRQNRKQMERLRHEMRGDWMQI